MPEFTDFKFIVKDIIKNDKSVDVSSISIIFSRKSEHVGIQSTVDKEKIFFDKNVIVHSSMIESAPKKYKSKVASINIEYKHKQIGTKKIVEEIKLDKILNDSLKILTYSLKDLNLNLEIEVETSKSKGKSAKKLESVNSTVIRQTAVPQVIPTDDSAVKQNNDSDNNKVNDAVVIDSQEGPVSKIDDETVTKNEDETVNVDSPAVDDDSKIPENKKEEDDSDVENVEAQETSDTVEPEKQEDTKVEVTSEVIVENDVSLIESEATPVDSSSAAEIVAPESTVVSKEESSASTISIILFIAIVLSILAAIIVSIEPTLMDKILEIVSPKDSA